MARFYVKKNDKWNIFSSIVDDFLYSDFMPFEELQAVVIGETVVDKMKDLGTLLTSSPRFNTMSYEEAEEYIRARRPADVHEEGDDLGSCRDDQKPDSTGSPIGDYRDGVGAWQTDCPWK
jgi:hypothetical protein